MEVDVASFQTDFPGSPIMCAAGRRISTENVQLSGGLMRYHSAPSSMLASLLDDDFYPCDSSQNDEAEFARFLSNGLGSSLSFVSSAQVDKAGVSSLTNEIQEGQRSDRSRMVLRQPSYTAPGEVGLAEEVKSAPLCAILENGMEDTLMDNCCRDQSPSHEQLVQSHQRNRIENNCYGLPMMPDSEITGRTQEKSTLFRHSSSPAGLLSRMAGYCMLPAVQKMPEHNFTGNTFVRSAVGTAATGPRFSEANCLMGKIIDGVTVGSRNRTSICEPNQSGLLRQSSSPAGLLSQLAVDVIPTTVGEKLSISASSGTSSEEGVFDERGATAGVGNFVTGSWEEAGSGSALYNAAAFGQRKRGRNIDPKILRTTLLAEPSQMYAADDLRATVPSATAVHLGGFMVPCKARAKRGCATHPRSIAERVRRTKISERMRKLQELVPSMDKQTNTADMLDEAVEYVRSLQRQVQELSETRSMCNGRCQLKKNTSF